MIVISIILFHQVEFRLDTINNIPSDTEYVAGVDILFDSTCKTIYSTNSIPVACSSISVSYSLAIVLYVNWVEYSQDIRTENIITLTIVANFLFLSWPFLFFL
jgi:hypothetical protein